MKKLFLITFISMFFIGCLEPSPEKLNSNWVKSVKGKTFVSPDNNTLFLVFDDAGNISIGNVSESDVSVEDVITGLLANMMKLEFFRSLEKNKAIYEFKFLFMAEYVGFSIDGKNLYMHSGKNEIPEDINWEVYDEEVYSLYKGK